MENNDQFNNQQPNYNNGMPDNNMQNMNGGQFNGQQPNYNNGMPNNNMQNMNGGQFNNQQPNYNTMPVNQNMNGSQVIDVQPVYNPQIVPNYQPQNLSALRTSYTLADTVPRDSFCIYGKPACTFYIPETSSPQSPVWGRAGRWWRGRRQQIQVSQLS